MPSAEKVAMLRTRAQALRERAFAVERTFTDPSMRGRATAVRLAIEQELGLLDADPSRPLPSLKRFLPAPAATLKELEAIAHRLGPHATPTSRASARQG